MKIMGVIDWKGDAVVHAIAGEREKYRPIESVLTRSTDAVDVAKAFRDQLGITEIYLADLDAIGGKEPSVSVATELVSLGFTLWWDAGIRDVEHAKELRRTAPVDGLVLGLESIESMESLPEMVKTLGAENLVMSIDLRDGRPLVGDVDLQDVGAEEIVDRVLRDGMRRLLFLDLARVGTGTGIGTEVLARRALDDPREPEVYVGGGVSGHDSVRRHRAEGIDGVLVASSLHDGRLRRSDIDQLRSESVT